MTGDDERLCAAVIDARVGGMAVDLPGGDSYEEYVLSVKARGCEVLSYDSWKAVRNVLDKLPPMRQGLWNPSLGAT